MGAGVSFIREDKLGPYLDALRRAGLDPVPISPAQPRGLEGLRGLVLTGGGDVDPALYREQPHPETRHVSRARDELEARLIAEAYGRDLPVLGICRGLQMLNVARGGTLLQHVEGHREVEHAIRAAPGSKTAICVGQDEYQVNSRHHQAAGTIAPGLVITAQAQDGIVEAVEDPAMRFVVAVQWHPEDRIDRESRDLRVFRAFAKAVRG